MKERDNYYLNLNLSYLKEIKEVILNTEITSHFKVSSANNLSPVLNKNDKNLNNINNPQDECKALFKNCPKDQNILIVGLELGYTLKFACKNYNAQITLFENDFELIRYVLQKINLIEYLAKPNFKFITNISDIQIKDKTSIIANEYYQKEYKEIISQIKKSHLIGGH